MGYSVEYFDKVLLGSHLYGINAAGNVLEDLEQRGNFLEYAQMENAKGQLKFMYNSERRCIEKSSERAGQKKEHVHDIVLPFEVAHLQHEQSLKVYDNINRLSRYHGYGFQKLGEDYVERDIGIRPRIELPEWTYYLHVQKNALGSVLNTSTVSLENLVEKHDQKGSWLEGVYDKDQRSFLAVDLQKAPVGSYFIQFPSLRAMDPYGVAEMEGKRPYHYLTLYPIVKNIVPLHMEVKMSNSASLKRMAGNVKDDLPFNTSKRKAPKL
ncbi:hypothetical protein [Chitinophaga defluvii]|uniref:Uncharacterized protein n=1 Tax=Chitinophaga defluvii TaxID=3163343 RepID=A0ABV2TCE2_9BACT